MECVKTKEGGAACMEWNKNGSVTVREFSQDGNVSCAVKRPPSGFPTYCDVRTPLLKVWMKLNTLIAPRLPNAHYESLHKVTLPPPTFGEVKNVGENMLKSVILLINKAVDVVTYQVLSAGIHKLLDEAGIAPRRLYIDINTFRAERPINKRTQSE